MKLRNDLINKYNRPGPRYTSFPPIPFWNNTPDENTWIKHILNSYDEDKGIDLYVHVPYCESLCYYCGCNRAITKNHSVEDPFVDSVLKEWELYIKKLGLIPKVNSLHFGGGTPTFLSPENLNRLIKGLLKKTSSSFLGSIEIDPRTCLSEHLAVLKENNIKRTSLGIQDFDPLVQKAIHREQSPEMVCALVEKLRQMEMPSINFDLIYGLPRQTEESIRGTIETVIDMRPDLIAFYSYAHLPERIRNQKLIREEELPSPEKKRALYELGKKLLVENGYIDVGMDHFALPGSYLYEAKLHGTLHRNFMGYVDKKSSVLIGLGPTSISDSSLSFVQNVKDIEPYRQKVSSGKLPIEKGHTHSPQDLNVQKVILDLMCNERTYIDWKTIPHSEAILNELQEFQNDGLIELVDEELIVSEQGKAFVRNVAMTFDFYLRQKNGPTGFSQTI